ncbi:hypothetical protein ACS0TY_015477 [Phlomoides rotata]
MTIVAYYDSPVLYSLLISLLNHRIPIRGFSLQIHLTNTTTFSLSLTMAPSSAKLHSLLCAFLLAAAIISAVHSIGVNYDTVGNNLPPPAQVAQFLKEKTTIDRIKIFNVNPDILRAFADTGILVAVTAPNGEIPSLTDAATARQWVSSHIKPIHPQTKINYILIGNEILHWGPQPLVNNLVAAMKTLHQALLQSNITDIKITTAHSLGILESSDPPSTAKFRPGWDTGVLAPLLQFHRETKTPLMVNPYPYFGYSPGNATCHFRKKKTRGSFTG